jgi:hypothetical protein
LPARAVAPSHSEYAFPMGPDGRSSAIFFGAGPALFAEKIRLVAG